MLAAVDAISLNAAFWIAIGYALDRVALIGVVLIFWIVPVILEALTEGDGLLEIDFSKISHPYLLIGGFVAFDAVIPLLIVGGRFVPGRGLRIGTALGDYPLVSILISTAFTGVIVLIMFFVMKRRWERAKASQGTAEAFA